MQINQMKGSRLGKNQLAGSFKVIAHRGANREALQNTMEAFEAAIEGGSDRIELDVHRTKDDTLVLYHDFEVAGRKIENTTLSKLQEHKLSDGTHIVTLDKALELLKRIELNIEIKPTDRRTVEVVADYVKGKDIDKLLFSSFYGKTIGHLKDFFPAKSIACLWGTEQLDSTSHPLSYFAPQVFMETYGTQVFHPRATMVDRAMMEYAKLQNWVVYPWCAMAEEKENKEDLWGELIELGADGLCTNEPRALRIYLDLMTKRQKILEEDTGVIPHISFKE